MQIEPSDAFAERERDEPQVVWTTLVADLETPVSAFLKLGGGKAMSFLLELVEGERSAGAIRSSDSIRTSSGARCKATPKSIVRRAITQMSSALAPNHHCRRFAH